MLALALALTGLGFLCYVHRRFIFGDLQPNWSLWELLSLLESKDVVMFLPCDEPSSVCASLQRYIAFEDSHDGEKKDLQCRLLTMESHTRQLELKIKNYADQSEFETVHVGPSTESAQPTCTGVHGPVIPDVL